VVKSAQEETGKKKRLDSRRLREKQRNRGALLKRRKGGKQKHQKPKCGKEKRVETRFAQIRSQRDAEGKPTKKTGKLKTAAEPTQKGGHAVIKKKALGKKKKISAVNSFFLLGDQKITEEETS